jgi:WD40-like Beta Propeller Repeat
MKLDDLARSASDALVERSVPDVATALRDLKRTRSRRATGRVVAAGAAVAVVLGGWAVVSDDSGTPEPAEPVVRNGALLVELDEGLHQVDGDLQRLDLPDDRARYTAISFTADGTELVYTTDAAKVAAHDIASGGTRVLWSCPSVELCLVSTVASDGQRVAVPVDEGLEIHRAGRDDVELLRTPEPPAPYPAWSPDGETLAFAGASGLYTIDADGTGLRRLVAFEGEQNTFPNLAWSPDGDSIAYIEGEATEEGSDPGGPFLSAYHLRLVDRDGTDRRTVQELGSCYCIGLSSPDLAWAPDGSSIAFTKVVAIRNGGNARSDGVHLLDVGTGRTERLSRDDNGRLAWQPIVAE